MSPEHRDLCVRARRGEGEVDLDRPDLAVRRSQPQDAGQTRELDRSVGVRDAGQEDEVHAGVGRVLLHTRDAQLERVEIVREERSRTRFARPDGDRRIEGVARPDRALRISNREIDVRSLRLDGNLLREA